MAPPKFLWHLAEDLLTPAELSQLRSLVRTDPIDYGQLVKFDRMLSGPSISQLSCNGSGRYATSDRDVFRPLQYCSIHFHLGSQHGDLEWRSRLIIHMSSLHVESLVKRIGTVSHLPWPLGRAMRESVVRNKIDRHTWNCISKFTAVYNQAKHNVSQPKDTHLFSIEDAVLAYVISRKLGMYLYPVAMLGTDLAIFEQDCS
jgi:hypothetical protein